jgi:hypothetical protein
VGALEQVDVGHREYAPVRGHLGRRKGREEKAAEVAAGKRRPETGGATLPVFNNLNK